MQRKEKENCLSAQAGQGVPIPPCKLMKLDRNCYMCDSPDHLIRECPYVKTGNATFLRGMPPYNQGYWHGASISDAGSYVNMYGVLGMMISSPMNYPFSYMGVSPCMASLYGGMPTPLGFMQMGAAQSHVIPGRESPIPHTEIMNHPDIERKHTKKLRERDQTCDLFEDYCCDGTVRSHKLRFQSGKKSSPFNVEQRTRRKYSNQKHSSPHQMESYEVKDFHLVGHKLEDSLFWSLKRDQRTRYSRTSNFRIARHV
ncbi:hypothetical protein AXF42_Ash017109 [Apostasia shenzhenica]|uniref:CCHC-type domain-containing protein n=1 Tax=Apostasia shenzhenica TaxID=1088818 RepID=A0A2H9ZV41_9ASPA|nr:hypothetical protein AXF42_Ash017109 [Apostasia shenzhenica]